MDGSCYSGQPFLHLGSDTILSCCSVQQDDPLGPLGFAHTHHPIMEHIRTVVANLTLNVWYLDDGILVGSPHDIAAALNIVESDDPSLGLNLNRSKSLLFIPKDADASYPPLSHEIPITQRGYTLLGSSIGPPLFFEDISLSRVLKVTWPGILQDMDSQMETALLRCLAFPKVVFTLQICPPPYIHHVSEKFDNLIQESLEAILAVTVPAWSWLKASLPSSRGDHGLRGASLHAPAAFLGSRMQAEPLMEGVLGHPLGPSTHMQLTLVALISAISCPDWTNPDEADVPLHQTPVSLTIDETTECRLLFSVPDTRSRALALSSGLSHVGDLLNIVPSVFLGLHRHDQELSSLNNWLEVSLHGVSYQCPECSCMADIYGDNQVACGGNRDHITCHNYLRDVIFVTAQAVVLGPRRKAPCLIHNSSSHPADILLPSWSQGRFAAMDVSIISLWWRYWGARAQKLSST